MGAAKKLSADSYDFLKAIDWNEATWAQLPSASPPVVLDAIKPVLAMGAAMDSAALKKGVTTLADYEAINAAIGHMVASVPAWKTLDVWTLRHHFAIRSSDLLGIQIRRQRREGLCVIPGVQGCGKIYSALR